MRTLDTFDFDAQAALIDPRQVRELATGRGDALPLLGPPGVGKTHLAIALGREVIQRRYTVLFTTAATLLAHLAKAQPRTDSRTSCCTSPSRSCSSSTSSATCRSSPMLRT